MRQLQPPNVTAHSCPPTYTTKYIKRGRIYHVNESRYAKQARCRQKTDSDDQDQPPDNRTANNARPIAKWLTKSGCSRRRRSTISPFVFRESGLTCARLPTLHFNYRSVRYVLLADTSKYTHEEDTVPANPGHTCHDPRAPYRPHSKRGTPTEGNYTHDRHEQQTE